MANSEGNKRKNVTFPQVDEESSAEDVRTGGQR